jgi:hypothetical protein
MRLMHGDQAAELLMSEGQKQHRDDDDDDDDDDVDEATQKALMAFVHVQRWRQNDCIILCGF